LVSVFLGTLVCWVVSKRITAQYLFAAWGFLAGAVFVSGQNVFQLLFIGISGLLWWSYERDRMASVLSGRIWQFLGGISYSLYLFHSSIGWRLVRAPHLLLGVTPVPVVIFVIYLTSIIACILWAWTAWRILEKRFMELSKVVSLPKQEVFPKQVSFESNRL